MQVKRLKHLFSPRRYSRCRELFQAPGQAFFKLSFLGKSEFRLTLAAGRSAVFSRRGRDHKFWDWFFRYAPPIDFTEDGLVQIAWQGRSVFLRPGTQDFFIFHEIFIDDDYHLAAMRGGLGTVVDLGANAGLFSCAMLGRAERVISVEAVAQNHRHTVRNIALGGGNPDDVWHLAVAENSGEELRLYHNSRNSGGHSVNREWSEQAVAESDYESTLSISLADLLARAECEQVDLLKCDIEGSEYAAFLSTGHETLQRIRRIVMEVHVSETYTPSLLLDLIAHLKVAGFEVRLDGDIPSSTTTQARMLYAERHHRDVAKAA